MTDKNPFGELGYQVSDPILILIGRIFVRFGYLENLIEMLINGIAKISDVETSSIILATMNFSNKTAVLRGLVEEEFKGKPRTLKKFQKAYSAIQHAQGQRNKIAHARWYTFEKLPNYAVFRYFKMRGKLESEIGAMTERDFEDIIQCIEKATRRLQGFIVPEDDPEPSTIPPTPTPA